jgi:integrase
MARRSTGGIVTKATSRGTSYGLRFRAGGRRRFVHLGYMQAGWTRERAEEELAYTLAQVRRGEWEPYAEPAAERVMPTFREFASDWIADREGELRQTTMDTYRWELTNHLLPFFHGVRVDEITVEQVDRYRQRKVSEGKLGATSINKTITRLGQVLDVAQERELIVQNPVRVNPRNRKVKAVRPRRPWLEPDQVVALLDAARGLDSADRALPIRRPLLATLAWAGLRVGEACALRWRHVDLAVGVIRVEQAKTDAGVREVDVQPELHDELLAWRARTPFDGRDDFVFPTRTGGAQNRHNVRQRVVLSAVARANDRLTKAGYEPLPDGLSPHALRRSFASWLLAEGEDVPYVQEQLGHTDPTMTLGVYAKAVRNGRRSARSRRRMESLEGAPTGTETSAALAQRPGGLLD